MIEALITSLRPTGFNSSFADLYRKIIHVSCEICGIDESPHVDWGIEHYTPYFYLWELVSNIYPCFSLTANQFERLDNALTESSEVE